MPTSPSGSSKRKPPTRRSRGTWPLPWYQRWCGIHAVTSSILLGTSEAPVHRGHQPWSSPPRNRSQKKSRDPRVMVTGRRGDPGSRCRRRGR